MDLKGSLVDTNLKIYATEKLIEFIKTIPTTKDLPNNILQIKTDDYKKDNLNDTNDVMNETVQLSGKDIENIKIIQSLVEDSIPEIIQNDGTEENIQNDEKVTSDNKLNDNTSDEQELVKDDDPYVITSDLDWLYMYIKKKRDNGEKDIPYLHTLLEGSYIETPKNKILKRNPVLEARCVKLRAQQEARDYRKMTKGVDNVRIKYPEDNISYQLKQINRQLIAVGQFIISIFAGFLFGFRGVEWMVGNLDFGFRLLLGVMCALVIALAEIYFLAKQLNEELSMPETVQLGGPPKFVDEHSYQYKDISNITNKPHQD